jgi:uncharacterized protein involved in type VI secretion and phage assembly
MHREEEGLSQGYALQVVALSTDAHIPFETLLAQPALLQLLTASSRDDLRPYTAILPKWPWTARTTVLHAIC